MWRLGGGGAGMGEAGGEVSPVLLRFGSQQGGECAGAVFTVSLRNAP